MGEAVPGVTIRQAGEVSLTLERNQQAVVLWKSDDDAFVQVRRAAAAALRGGRRTSWVPALRMILGGGG